MKLHCNRAHPNLAVSPERDNKTAERKDCTAIRNKINVVDGPSAGLLTQTNQYAPAALQQLLLLLLNHTDAAALYACCAPLQFQAYL
jgi:hypothetical protein